MRVDASPFGSVGGRASVIAKVSFIFPPRYSVLALLVLTSPLYPTRKIGDFSRRDPDFASLDFETNGDGVKPGSPPKVFSVGLSPVPVCFGVIRELT